MNNRETSLDELESFGLVDDCSIFPELSNYVFFLSGAIEATLKALDHGFRYVINWDGGRHHAQASLASGFCYINGKTDDLIHSQSNLVYRCCVVNFESRRTL